MSDDGPYGDLDVTRSLTVPAALLQWRFSRSSGPGGQGVNTADSRAELSVHLGSLQGPPADWPEGIVDTARRRLGDRLVDDTLAVSASEHRQQLRNRQAARVRLAALLREATAPSGPRRRATRPSAGARQRRLDDKKRRSQLKRARRTDTD